MSILICILHWLQQSILNFHPTWPPGDIWYRQSITPSLKWTFNFTSKIPDSSCFFPTSLPLLSLLCWLLLFPTSKYWGTPGLKFSLSFLPLYLHSLNNLIHSYDFNSCVLLIIPKYISLTLSSPLNFRLLYTTSYSIYLLRYPNLISKVDWFPKAFSYVLSLSLSQIIQLSTPVKKSLFMLPLQTLQIHQKFLWDLPSKYFFSWNRLI